MPWPPSSKQHKRLAGLGINSGDNNLIVSNSTDFFLSEWRHDCGCAAASMPCGVIEHDDGRRIAEHLARVDRGADRHRPGREPADDYCTRLLNGVASVLGALISQQSGG